MQRLAVVLIVTLFAGGSAQAAGRFAKLLSRNEMEHGPLRSRPTGVKLLELELVKSPGVRQIVDEFATLQFRVRQLNNPDPQYVPPPIRLRRYSLSGAQLEQAWLHPNGEGTGMLRVTGYRFGIDGRFMQFEEYLPDRRNLMLPEQLIENNMSGHEEELTKERLDILWQAFGLTSCNLYTQDATWRPNT